VKVTQTLCTKADEWLGPFEKPRLDGLCRPSANRAERVELPAQKEQVLYIQRRLQAGGYKIKADGKFGKESRRLARDYLAKAGQRPLQNSPKSPKFPPRHLGDFP